VAPVDVAPVGVAPVDVAPVGVALVCGGTWHDDSHGGIVLRALLLGGRWRGRRRTAAHHPPHAVLLLVVILDEHHHFCVGTEAVNATAILPMVRCRRPGDHHATPDHRLGGGISGVVGALRRQRRRLIININNNNNTTTIIIIINVDRARGCSMIPPALAVHTARRAPILAAIINSTGGGNLVLGSRHRTDLCRRCCSLERVPRERR
jgi:hypothetical protein